MELAESASGAGIFLVLHELVDVDRGGLFRNVGEPRNFEVGLQVFLGFLALETLGTQESEQEALLWIGHTLAAVGLSAVRRWPLRARRLDDLFCVHGPHEHRGAVGVLQRDAVATHGGSPHWARSPKNFPSSVVV